MDAPRGGSLLNQTGVLVRTFGRSFVHAITAIVVSAVVVVGFSVPASADPSVGSLAGTVAFSEDCSSGIGVGIAFDGSNLWYSCYQSSTDLLRADPKTGQVTARYSIAGGLGALAYDAARNLLWAGWGSSQAGDITAIQLDGNQAVAGSSKAFSTCPLQCGSSLDDGLAYDASTQSLMVSADGSPVISTFKTSGAQVSTFDWAGTGGCYNSGLALGDQLIFEGADGCSHVYVVDKSDPSKVLFDFSTAVPGDPNFRDEGLTCDTKTYAAQGQQVMWSKEAYSPMRAHAFVIPAGTCGIGGESAPGGGTTNTAFTGPSPSSSPTASSTDLRTRRSSSPSPTRPSRLLEFAVSRRGWGRTSPAAFGETQIRSTLQRLRP